MSADSLDDQHFIRVAIQEAQLAQEAGNPAFGAVLVAPDGTVMGRARNTEGETGDCTEHAETNLVRDASKRCTADRLQQATLYSSTEPCPMCAGAIFCAGIGRVVFGLRAERLSKIKENAAPHLNLACEDVLARGNHDVEVVGPVLEDEAADVFPDGGSA